MKGQVISGNWPKVGDRRQVSGPTNGGWRCVAKWKGRRRLLLDDG